MGFAKHRTSSYGYLPSPTCCALGFKPFRREAQTNSDQRPIEEVHNRRTTATHTDRTFRKSPKTVQVQDNFNQVPRTYNKHVMLWSSTAGVFHMALPSFSWPLGSYIIGSSMYLSARYLQHVQIKCNKLQEHPKNRAVKTVNKLNCKTMTTVKTVAHIVQWVHMCPTACKWHQTTYKWKQLTSNPKTVKWTSHELKSQDMKNPKLLQLSNTYKTDAQLLQDSWTASANRTGSPDNSSLHSFCKQLGTDSFCCS